MCGTDRWIEVLETEDGKLMYRACRQSGAICRYTPDRWQAEVYINY